MPECEHDTYPHEGECPCPNCEAVQACRDGRCEHNRAYSLDADVVECIDCGIQWDDDPCKHDQGVEEYDDGAEVCVMCGRTMRYAL